MKKWIFLLPVFLLADINPFNAGNLNSNNPYGLTPDEKAILQNKKEISKLKTEIDYLNNQISQIKLNISNYNDIINQKLAAFSTLLDEINSAKNNIQQLQNSYNSQEEEIKQINQKINSLENNLTNIKQSIKEITIIQNQNFMVLKNAIKEILNKLKNLNASKTLSPNEAFLKARKLYFSNKLNEAKKLFLYSLQKNHLPATTSYYLGEIAYKQKNYKEALAFYKKSVEFYPKKASFTARLLYHTGISFLKIGNKKAAKLTFEKLINDFPKSKYSTLAKKELEKLK